MKTAVLIVSFMFIVSSAQAQGFRILNPAVEQGDTVVVAVDPQWQGSLVCISVFEKDYLPNANGYVFIGIPIDAEPTGTQNKPDRYSVALVECGRGVNLNSLRQEFEVQKKNYSKTRIAARSRGTRPRVGLETSAIAKAFSASNDAEPDLTGGAVFNDPVNYSQSVTLRDVIDPYGLIYKNNNRLPHNGVDLRMPVGTPIRASNSGKVVLVANRFRREGNMIILNHGRGIYSVYMHLSRINVKEGQIVEGGHVIGLSGRTGAGVREPHLHFNIKINGIYVDPLIFIDTVNQYLAR